MVADAPDWTRAITFIFGVSMSTADLPDWTEAISIPGSSSVYASLTGAGQSATPGDLTQAGGFTVNDTLSDGITLHSPTGDIKITTIDTTIEVHDSNPLGSVAVVTSGRVYLGTTAGAPMLLETVGGGGFQFLPHGGGISVGGGDDLRMGNFGGTPASQAGTGIIFVDNGALKYVGSAGTVTTIAPA